MKKKERKKTEIREISDNELMGFTQKSKKRKRKEKKGERKEEKKKI